MDRFGYLPNDEFALYDEADFRLRVLTTGGFSPDGVTGLRPAHVRGLLPRAREGCRWSNRHPGQGGRRLSVCRWRASSRRLVGPREGREPRGGVYYDDCYQEDRDNYIDIILVGDETAAKNVTAVEIPSLEGGYRAFYNPGGPGPKPFDGVRYSAPGPRDLEPVVMALDDSMRVSRDR